MVRSGSECCVLGLKSSVTAALFGLACASLGAVVASLCWANLELEVAVSPRLVEPVRKVSMSAESTNASQHHEHHTHPCDDCVFCRSRTEKTAEQLSVSFVPIHQRKDYTVQSPDILSINVTNFGGSVDNEQQPIEGEHLVHPDGKVDLGSWGKLNVGGKTTAEIKSAIEKLVDAEANKRSVRVSVCEQNSRVYYVITDGAGLGDSIKRVPYLGNETVLDAVASAGTLNEMARRRTWIARPTPGSEKLTAHQIATQAPVDTVIPVQWQWTSSTAAIVANHPLQAGDRIFITRPPWWMALLEHAANVIHARQARQVPPAQPVELK